MVPYFVLRTISEKSYEKKLNRILKNHQFPINGSMFKSIGRSVGTSRLGLGLMSVRTFVPLKRTPPTVFEPLPPKRNGEGAISFVHKKLLEKYDPTGKRRALVDTKAGVRAGDIIKVTYLDRTSVVGQVLGIKRGQQTLGTNILIRNKVNRVGVEMRIPLYNPNIRNIELLHKPTKYLPRLKQYYIRNTKYDVGDLEAYLRRESKKNA